jgi:hypothetical protein
MRKKRRTPSFCQKRLYSIPYRNNVSSNARDDDDDDDDDDEQYSCRRVWKRYLGCKLLIDGGNLQLRCLVLPKTTVSTIMRFIVNGSILPKFKKFSVSFDAISFLTPTNPEKPLALSRPVQQNDDVKKHVDLFLIL